MRKAMLYKLGGFTAAVVATGALIATSVAATGAYFSDSEAGSIQGKSGHLQIAITGGATELNYNELVPGQKLPQHVTYTIDESATATADVWLVFDKSSTQWGDLTGKKTTGTNGDGGLGRWGYFGVAVDGTPVFQSGNLAYASSLNNTYDGNLPYNASGNGFTCAIGTDGHGGTAYENTALVMPSSPASTAGPTCGIPDKILLASGVNHGFTSTVSLTLGLNIASTAQNSWVVKSGNVPFKIVAVQSGLGVAPSF